MSGLRTHCSLLCLSRAQNLSLLEAKELSAHIRSKRAGQAKLGETSKPTGGKVPIRPRYMRKSTGCIVTIRSHLIEVSGSSKAWYGGEGGYLKSRSQFRLALPRRGPAPSWAPHAGDTSPASPLFKSRPLYSRCRASDTFSRRWKYMARWYYWRATAETLRTDVSRAKFGGEGGI